MKGRFSTVDIAVEVRELKRFIGMRVINVYDIDNKTYLIRVGRPDEKTVILMESGIRLHSTDFDWPKNPAPSNFSMKLRKHLKGRRLESITQLGVDRIVDLQFGSGEAAYHIIIELYDRGNMVLTDYEFVILTLLRPRTDVAQDVRFAVREKYPVDSSKSHQSPTRDWIWDLMKVGKDGEALKKFLVPHLDYGPAIIDHVLLGAGFPENVKFGMGFTLDTDFDRLMDAIQEAESLLEEFITKPCKGYIIQKKEKKPNPQPGEVEDLVLYEEFHPYLFRQHAQAFTIHFDRFDKAVDEFFSKLEGQRLDVKVIQQEKSALKKLENVKKDHEKRLQGLQREQELDVLRGQLIEMNLDLVDQAILTVRSAVANQIDWTEIWNLVKEAQASGDPVAITIKALMLDSNQITLLLHDPYVDPEDGNNAGIIPLKPMRIDIDLGLSAYGNSRRFFDKKKQAARKEQKTLESSSKAFRSAEKKTRQTLKEVATAASINRSRKTYWFEKFLWFISSENYLIIGGRDQQQNELIVKRYMKQGDLYVHADLHGASSCVVKNPEGNPVPPKTLNEAGTMAICNSAAWDSKVVTSAWWVYHDQVSKTAPSGEYLTTGSFMIRGKKNYLPPSYLIYGFGFLFKLEEGSVERHKGERKVKGTDEDALSMTDSAASVMPECDDIDISDDSAGDEETYPNISTPIKDAAVLHENSIHRNETEITDSRDEDGNSVNKSLEESGWISTGYKHISKTWQEVSDGSVTSDDKTETATEISTMDTEHYDSCGLEFPDTNISLQHIKGDKYELLRESTATSNTEDFFFLGDNVPVTLGQKTSSKSGKLSARQRRDMKKQKTGKPITQGSVDEEDEMSCLHPDKKDKRTDNSENHSDGNGSNSSKCLSTDVGQAGPLKRGQRAKKKKIKEKYAYQDEEERKLRMEILASAGVQKEDKRKRGKTGKTQVRSKFQNTSPSPRSPSEKNIPPTEDKPLISPREQDADAVDEMNRLYTAPETNHQLGIIKNEKQDADSDGDKEEESSVGDQDEAIFNALTGNPLPEDELLFAIPVCAPYSALVNYKFRVKLMPGTTKKGKGQAVQSIVLIEDISLSNR